MKFRKFFSRKSGDPMGALNDLAFLLIIYFLVIAGFSVNTGFLVGLPEKDQPRIVRVDELIRLSLAPGGELFFENTELGDEELAALLEEGLRTHPNLTVALSINSETPYQRFIDVVKRIRSAHVENYSFVMAEDAAS